MRDAAAIDAIAESHLMTPLHSSRTALSAFTLAAALLLAGANAASADVGRAHELRHGACRAIGGETFARTELFFGLSRPGGVITEQDFKNFVDVRVTPRFPDGLTLLSGSGQFRNAAGNVIAEGAKLLILLYPRRDDDANEKVEAIRRDYKEQFQQESVLRVDEVSCVSF